MFWKQVQPPRQNFVVETKGHRLQYLHGSGTLVVAFDDATRSRSTPFAGRPTWGEKFYRAEGNSLLGVIARDNDWFRCPELIASLRSLAGEGFFSGFDRVVMTGASMGGFAALAFAELVPGCTVIAMSPQLTRDPERVPWEPRFPNGRHRDWRLPYNDAARGASFAEVAYVFYDSLNRLDLRHAQLISAAPSACLMPIPAGGHGVPPMLVQMAKLKDVTRKAIANELHRPQFLRDMRGRKTTLRYFRILARECMYRRKNAFAVRCCDIGLKRFPNSDLLETKALALAAMGRPIVALETLDAASKRNAGLRAKSGNSH